MTKHEAIIQYIESLDVGTKISVRQIAKDLEVSEGTAYRAIKEAEVQGLVSSIERVGTVRIERKRKENFERLTFAELLKIVDGQVLGGRNGLHKSLNKFFIGAMQLDAMLRYIEPGSLLIVGNRYQAHKLALQHGTAVLITGGFDTSDEVKQLADQLSLPIISCGYDTFTVASMINRAIYDQLIKKEIMTVEDILVPSEQVTTLRPTQTVEDWQKLVQESKHIRFPVIDEENRLVGIVTSRDMVGAQIDTPIHRVMTKQPITITPQTSVASASHVMLWEGIEMLPIVDSNKVMLGIVTRQDLLKAQQFIQRQPQKGETFVNLIMSGFEEEESDGCVCFKGKVTPQMTNPYGNLSIGICTTLLTEAARRYLRYAKRCDMVPEDVFIYFIKPIQIDTTIHICTNILEMSRKFAKLEVVIKNDGKIMGKAILTAQLLQR